LVAGIPITPMTVKSKSLLSYNCCLMQFEFYFIYNKNERNLMKIQNLALKFYEKYIGYEIY